MHSVGFSQPPTGFQRKIAGQSGNETKQSNALILGQDVWRSLPPGYPGVPTGLWPFIGIKKGEPFKPFDAQWEILQSIRIPWPGLTQTGEPYPLIWGVNCGRRFSKTTTGEVLMWEGIIAPDDQFGPPAVRLTADTDEHAQKIWRRFVWHCENTKLRALVESHTKEYNLITFKTGATAQMLSAHNPQALSGDGVTLWVVDEAQFLIQAAWDNLLPSTAERSGIVVLLGVSEGEGPFREICFKGDSTDYPEFKRLCYPTAANPYVPRWVIEFHRRTMAPHKFKQLYLAQWVDELGKIFRNVEGCINADDIKFSEPDGSGYAFTSKRNPGRSYYAGLDLARLSDWTVFTIWDRSGRLVAWDRFSMVNWELQKARVAQLSALYGHPLTVVDSTGVGDPIYNDLIRLGMNVQEFKITGNDAKRALIDELAIRIGAGQLSYPRIQVFIEELLRFEAKKSATPGSTVVRYEAPSGYHDDFVLSAALAAQVMPRMQAIRPVPTGDPFADAYPEIYVDPRTGEVKEGIPPDKNPYREMAPFELI